MKLSDVKPSLYYRAGDEVEAAVRGAKLVWAKASDEEDDDNGNDNNNSGGGDNNGGGGGDDGSDED